MAEKIRFTLYLLESLLALCFFVIFTITPAPITTFWAALIYPLI